MLAIAAFEFARKGIVLFDESVVKYGDNCGAVINGLAMLVDRDAYLSYEYVDIKNENELGDKVNFLDQEVTTGAFIPENYKKTSGIPEEVQTCIKKVFTAGDMHTGQSLVVKAIRQGRDAAREVDEYLMGYTNLVSVM